MKGRIKLHLMMLVFITLCNTFSLVLAAGMSLDGERETRVLRESTLLAASFPKGEVVEIGSSGEATGEPVNLRCKRFEWLAKENKGISEEEPFDVRIRTFDISIMSVI